VVIVYCISKRIYSTSKHVFR